MNSLNFNDKIDHTKRVKLVSYSGNTIDTIGQMFLLCTYNGKVHKLIFHAIDKHTESLIYRFTKFAYTVLNTVTVNNVDLLQPCRSKLVNCN